MKQQNNIFILNIHTKMDEEVKWIYEEKVKKGSVLYSPNCHFKEGCCLGKDCGGCVKKK